MHFGFSYVIYTYSTYIHVFWIRLHNRVQFNKFCGSFPGYFVLRLAVPYMHDYIAD